MRVVKLKNHYNKGQHCHRFHNHWLKDPTPIIYNLFGFIPSFDLSDSKIDVLGLVVNYSLFPELRIITLVHTHEGLRVQESQRVSMFIKRSLFLKCEK